MRPPQGEQNNAALSFKKRRNTNDENSNERGGSYRKFDEDSLHARNLLHWKKIQNRPTPQPSPVSSDDEDSTNECASDEEEDHHGVMVFGEDDLDLDEFNADD